LWQDRSMQASWIQRLLKIFRSQCTPLLPQQAAPLTPSAKARRA
jgi:hypothetical protein